MGGDERKDKLSQKLIENVLEWERPDLAVLTGDIVSGNRWDKVT